MVQNVVSILGLVRPFLHMVLKYIASNKFRSGQLGNSAVCTCVIMILQGLPYCICQRAPVHPFICCLLPAKFQACLARAIKDNTML